MIKLEILPYLGFTTYYHLINPYMQGLTDENITLGIICDLLAHYSYPFMRKSRFSFKKMGK